MDAWPYRGNVKLSAALGKIWVPSTQWGPTAPPPPMRGVRWGQPARRATLRTMHTPPACSGREPHITPPIPRGWSWCTPAPLSTWRFKGQRGFDRQTGGGRTSWCVLGCKLGTYSGRGISLRFNAPPIQPTMVRPVSIAPSHFAPSATRACSLAPNSAAWISSAGHGGRPFGSGKAGGLKFCWIASTRQRETLVISLVISFGASI